MPVALRTRIFGTVRGALALPVEQEPTATPASTGAPNLVFPGLRAGRAARAPDADAARARRSRRATAPSLAQGEARALASSARWPAEIAGRVGPAPPERAAELARRGVPAGAPVGLTGLEREFDDRLRRHARAARCARASACSRSSPPQRGSAVRTTIDPRVQRPPSRRSPAASAASPSLRPRTGEVLALAGVAYSAPQPPGSTFKIVTLAGALQAGVVKPTEHFPVADVGDARGRRARERQRRVVRRHAARSRSRSPATRSSRRSAPSSAPGGSSRRPSASASTRTRRWPARRARRSRRRDEIGDDLAVGSTAIGQGKVLATPLQMASVAAAIGERRRARRVPTLRKGDAGRRVARDDAPPVARTSRATCARVVRGGTGVGAAIPGVAVAGKTGTAELRTTRPGRAGAAAAERRRRRRPRTTRPTPTRGSPRSRRRRSPRVAVAVLLVGQGAGGDDGGAGGARRCSRPR